MEPRIRIWIVVTSFIFMFIGLPAQAQAMNESQIVTRLNDIIRAKNTPANQQIDQINELLASANALHADAAENAILAYKLLVTAQQENFEPVRSMADEVLTTAVRRQDYRSQAFTLRARIRYQAIASPDDVELSKQELLGLLTRRLSDEDKAQILFDIGLADIQTGNVMSALEYFNQAQEAFWTQSNYASWREVVNQQIDLLIAMQWFDRALEKVRQLVDFSKDMSGEAGNALQDKLLAIMAADNQWQDMEKVALTLLEESAEKGSINGQFIAGYWLMHVNVQQQNMDLVTRWHQKIEDWLSEHPQLKAPELYTLNKITYLIETGNLPAAKALQDSVTLENDEGALFSYLTTRQHLLNQVGLAAANNNIQGITSAYEELIAWMDAERSRVLSLTMDQISQDFAAMQRSTQREILSLNQTLESEKEAVGKEATFNNLLIVIVGLLMAGIAVLSYFYIRLKNQKQSSRRRGSSRSSA
jgi:tetratricopeptide (TPR) repeat protein